MQPNVYRADIPVITRRVPLHTIPTIYEPCIRLSRNYFVGLV